MKKSKPPKNSQAAPSPKVYLDEAVARGAHFASLIHPRSVHTAAWVRLKCQFGCGGYGSSLCCPPLSPTPEETARLLNNYSHALFFAFRIDDASAQRHFRKAAKHLVVELEREAFLDGHEKALGLGCGPCDLCRSCDTSGTCLHPELARPSMEACGIDVFSTARAAGLELRTVRKGDPYWRCSLLLIG